METLYAYVSLTIVWDMRSLRSPVALRRNLTTLYPNTNAIFSPDEKFILTGIGTPTRGAKGKLVILNRDGLEIVQEIGMDSTPVTMMWHPKINQV